jgi:6-pyruvoyltetrahydropterin/6-carboxytetrahydropterin synthase
MYQVAVARNFIAQHYLIGGDWGAENELHSHHYQIELILSGSELDQHSYLVDIVDIEKALEALIARYRDHTLNDLPEFAGVNPSIEWFARLLCQSLAAHIQAPNLTAITVKLWENTIAWASYQILIENN